MPLAGSIGGRIGIGGDTDMAVEVGLAVGRDAGVIERAASRCCVQIVFSRRAMSIALQSYRASFDKLRMRGDPGGTKTCSSS